MPTVLSIENDPGWSWGNTIHQLIDVCLDYEFIRVRRGLFYCRHPPCGAAFVFPLDTDLQDHFDLMLVQNHDGVRYLKRRDKTIVRIGGLVMTPNLDPNRYAEDFQKVGAVIATNDLLASFARPHNPHTTVIANGVDLTHFRPGPYFPGGNPERPFTLGFAGNIVGMGGPYKGWPYFVQACVDLAPAGVVRKVLLHQCNQIPHDEMPEGFYWQINALVLPSQGEGCSNVITEALACGVPVICTKTGFHGERLTEGENVLYIERDLTTDSPQTTRHIVDAVHRLMTEPDLYSRLSQNGRAFAVAHHDVLKVAAQYRAVFEGVLGRRESQVKHAGNEQASGTDYPGGGGHLGQRG